MFADYSKPNSYTEAVQSDKLHEWQSAMDDEMKLVKNPTFRRRPIEVRHYFVREKFDDEGRLTVEQVLN